MPLPQLHGEGGHQGAVWLLAFLTGTSTLITAYVALQSYFTLVGQSGISAGIGHGIVGSVLALFAGIFVLGIRSRQTAAGRYAALFSAVLFAVGLRYLIG